MIWNSLFLKGSNTGIVIILLPHCWVLTKVLVVLLLGLLVMMMLMLMLRQLLLLTTTQ